MNPLRRPYLEALLQQKGGELVVGLRREPQPEVRVRLERAELLLQRRQPGHHEVQVLQAEPVAGLRRSRSRLPAVRRESVKEIHERRRKTTIEIKSRGGLVHRVGAVQGRVARQVVYAYIRRFVV